MPRIRWRARRCSTSVVASLPPARVRRPRCVRPGLNLTPPLARLAARPADRPESSARQYAVSGAGTGPAAARTEPAGRGAASRKLTGEAEHSPWRTPRSMSPSPVGPISARLRAWTCRKSSVGPFVPGGPPPRSSTTTPRWVAGSAAGLPRPCSAHDPIAVRRFWRRQGFTARDLPTRAWECPDRATFRGDRAHEFAPALADRILATHPGTSVDYAVAFWHRTH